MKFEREIYPVEAYFNRLSNDEFLLALENFSRGVGYNPEDMTCFFPSDTAEEEGGSEADYKFIEFWTYSEDEEVRLSFEQFLEILDVVATHFTAEQPSLKEHVLMLTNRTRQYLTSL